MSWASPWFLVLLVPWGVAGVWMLRRAPRTADVPFLSLWGRGAVVNPARRGWRPPGVAVLLALAAALLGVIAAAGPGGGGRVPVVVVDRGPTMVGRSGAALRAIGGEVELYEVPGTGHRRGVSVGTSVAADTRAAMAETLAALGPGSIAVTDAPLPAGVIRGPVGDVPAVRLAWVSGAGREALVRAWTDGRGGVVRVGGVDVPVPPERGWHDVRTAWDGVDDELSAEVDGDRVTARRATAEWPVAEAGVPPAVARVVEAYRTARGREGAVYGVGASEAARVRVVPAGDVASGAVEVVEDPLTAGVDWAAALRDARVGGPLPGRALVRVGGRAVVSVEGGRVWVGFASPAMERSAEWVVFWTRVLDRAGHVEATWRPVAPRAEVAPVPVEPDARWRERVSTGGVGGSNPVSWVLLGATVLLGLAGVMAAASRAGGREGNLVRR